MPENSEAPLKRLEIKKYSNRRYYDATHSRHLTLDEMRALIQQGHDIRVADAKSGADITAQVLTQLILEHDTTKLDSLPVPLLVRLIRANDQLIKDFIEKYFNQALQSFFDYQQQVEEQIRRTHGLPTAFPSVSALTRAVLEPFASAFSRAAPAETEPARSASSSVVETQELREIIAELQRQVVELKGKRRAGEGRGRPKSIRGTRRAVRRRK